MPRTAAMYCVYDDDEWLPCSVASVYPVLDAIYFFVSDSPWNGPKTGNEATLRSIAALPDPDKKVVLCRGGWTDQVEQRNQALAQLIVDGFDYTFIIDADEIYNAADLRNMLLYAYSRPEIGCWHTVFIHFWKSHKYRIDPPEDHHPPILMGTFGGSFVEYRNPLCSSHELIPPALGVCFHMSWARTDEQIWRKINACSFAPLVKEDWWEKKWRAWDGDHSITDLCPYNRKNTFYRAVEVPFELLPDVLKEYVSSGNAPVGSDR